MNNLANGLSSKIPNSSFGQSLHGSKKKLTSNFSIALPSGNNEYQVFTQNIESIGSSLSPDSAISKQSNQKQTKKQSVTYATSFMKTFKQPSTSSEGNENGIVAFNSHRKSQIINPQSVSNKSSESSGLTQASQLWMGQQSDKHLPKQNFYFPAAKKTGITKRAPFQGNPSGGDNKVVQENPKKTSLIGGTSLVQDQQPSKISLGMHSPLFTSSQRSSMDCLFFDKRKQQNLAFAHISPPRLSLPLETEPTLGHSSQQTFLQTPEQRDEGQFAVELRRLQMLANQQKIRIDALEKTNAEQKEQLKLKQNTISDYEEQLKISSSSSSAASQGRCISGTNKAARNNQDQKNPLHCSVLSSNQSFSGKDKQTFNQINNTSTNNTQNSAGVIKSRNSPHQSLLGSQSSLSQGSHILISKKLTQQQQQSGINYTQPSSSAQDIVLPSTPKHHKEKVLSMNIHESQVKDFILKTHRHTSSHPSEQTRADSEVISIGKISQNGQEQSSETFAQSFKSILERTKKLLEKQSKMQQFTLTPQKKNSCLI